MILEVLYSNVANLYGDLYNVNVLKETLKEQIEIKYTELYQTPYFADHDVDMVYMGSMMERFQQNVIESLIPYVTRINEMIEKNVVFLMTGNSFEVFGQRIDQMDGLKIFNFNVNRDYSHHHNSCYLGKFDNQYITGYKSCFSYVDDCEEVLFETLKGYGYQNRKQFEGVRRNNFFGTYLIGPILIQNPYFTHYLLGLLNMDCEIKNEQAILEAFNVRVQEYLTYEDFKEFKH